MQASRRERHLNSLWEIHSIKSICRLTWLLISHMNLQEHIDEDTIQEETYRVGHLRLDQKTSFFRLIIGTNRTQFHQQCSPTISDNRYWLLFDKQLKLSDIRLVLVGPQIGSESLSRSFCRYSSEASRCRLGIRFSTWPTVYRSWWERIFTQWQVEQTAAADQFNIGNIPVYLWIGDA